MWLKYCFLHSHSKFNAESPSVTDCDSWNTKHQAERWKLAKAFFSFDSYLKKRIENDLLTYILTHENAKISRNIVHSSLTKDLQIKNLLWFYVCAITFFEIRNSNVFLCRDIRDQEHFFIYITLQRFRVNHIIQLFEWFFFQFQFY